MAKQQHLHCSFCGKSKQEVKLLIAGQDGHICESCVENAHEILAQELVASSITTPAPIASKLSVKKPIETKKFLDEYVIGQDDAKKILAELVNEVKAN